MNSNTHSTSAPAGTPVGLSALAAELQGLADQPLDGLADAARAERVMALQGLADRLHGQLLAELADLDARGAAGAEQGLPAPSTAAWLRHRLHMSATTATSLVRTARALYRGPLVATAQALADGAISPAHAQVLAAGTHDLPTHTAAEAEPVLLAVARRLDPPRLRRAITHLRLVADPDSADTLSEQQQQQQRGLWVSPTWEGMVAVNGLLDPEAGQMLLAALDPLARPTNADDTRSGGQRRADALAEWPAAPWRAASCPRPAGCGPSCWSPSTWTACWVLAGWAGTPMGWDRWTPRPAGGWLVTARSPGSWSPAGPLVTAVMAGATAPTTTTAMTTAGAMVVATTTTTTTTTAAGLGAWRACYGRRRPGCRRPWGVP
jgi:hypothetical protein